MREKTALTKELAACKTKEKESAKMVADLETAVKAKQTEVEQAKQENAGLKGAFTKTYRRTRPDIRHKMRLVCVFSPSKITRDGPTDGRTNERTDRRTRPLIEMRRRI